MKFRNFPHLSVSLTNKLSLPILETELQLKNTKNKDITTEETRASKRQNASCSIIAIFLVYICVDLRRFMISICNIDEYRQLNDKFFFDFPRHAVFHSPSILLPFSPVFHLFEMLVLSTECFAIHTLLRSCKCTHLKTRGENVDVRIRQWNAPIPTPITHDYMIHWWMRSPRYSSDARWRSTRYYLFCCRCGDIYHRFHGLRRRAAGEHMPVGRGKRIIGFD